MGRKIVRTGSFLAVTLPKDIVDQLGLRKGDEVEVTAQPLNRTIVIRTVHEFEDGKVTKKFQQLSKDLLKRRAKLYRGLAK